MLLAIFNFLKRAIFNWVLQLLNGSLSNATLLRFAAMVPAGAIADAVGSTVRVPFAARRKGEAARRRFTKTEMGLVCFVRFLLTCQTSRPGNVKQIQTQID